jgi:hypothetical protein
MRSTEIHYDNGKEYDVIDFIQDYELNFNRGNIIKYVARASRKGAELRDLRKAKDYIDREIEFLENKRDEQWKQDSTL